jgi:hypothetical protein
MGIARAYIDALLVVIGEWPVDEVKIEVIQTQVAQRFARAGVGVAVTVIPNLTGDPEFFATDSFGEYTSQGDPNFAFVAVDAGAINMAVTSQDGLVDGLGHFIGGVPIGPERAEPDARH